MPMVAACRRPTPRRPWRARQREVPNPRSPGRRAGPRDSAVQRRRRWTQGGRLVLQSSATCPPAPTPARTRPVEPVGRRTSRRRTTHEPVPAQRDPRRPGVGASPRAKARSRRPFRPSSAVRSPRFPLLGDRRPHRRALPGQCRPSRALPGKRHRLPARHRTDRGLPGKRPHALPDTRAAHSLGSATGSLPGTGRTAHSLGSADRAAHSLGGGTHSLPNAGWTAPALGTSAECGRTRGCSVRRRYVDVHRLDRQCRGGTTVRDDGEAADVVGLDDRRLRRAGGPERDDHRLARRGGQRCRSRGDRRWLPRRPGSIVEVGPLGSGSWVHVGHGSLLHPTRSTRRRAGHHRRTDPSWSTRGPLRRGRLTDLTGSTRRRTILDRFTDLARRSRRRAGRRRRTIPSGGTGRRAGRRRRTNPTVEHRSVVPADRRRTG